MREKTEFLFFCRTLRRSTLILDDSRLTHKKGETASFYLFNQMNQSWKSKKKKSTMHYNLFLLFFCRHEDHFPLHLHFSICWREPRKVFKCYSLEQQLGGPRVYDRALSRKEQHLHIHWVCPQTRCGQGLWQKQSWGLGKVSISVNDRCEFILICVTILSFLFVISLCSTVCSFVLWNEEWMRLYLFFLTFGILKQFPEVQELELSIQNVRLYLPVWRSDWRKSLSTNWPMTFEQMRSDHRILVFSCTLRPQNQTGLP